MRHQHHPYHHHDRHHSRGEGFFEHFTRHFGGRHGHGGRGGGRLSGFMDEGGPGGRGMRTGRKLSSGDLQLLVLALLADKPRHGYEIIRVLEERSQGFYTPSPSMVYPALTYLEEAGYATVVAEGARKLYHLTDEGKAYLAENRTQADAMFEQFDRIGDRMDNVRRAFADEPIDERRGHVDFGHGGSEEIWQARRELKEAMIAARGSSPEEQQRIAEILRRAAAEIKNGSSSPTEK